MTQRINILLRELTFSRVKTLAHSVVRMDYVSTICPTHEEQWISRIPSGGHGISDALFL